MKTMEKWFMGLAMAAMLAITSGCEWGSGGDDSFNTSQGAGASINFSGVYHGNYSGGRAVESTSAGNITRLVISQSGNRLELTDNQGSKYSGTCGSPGVVSSASDGVYSTGAELVQGQVSWSGKDGVSAKDVTFEGVIHVVTVSDIRGHTVATTDHSEETIYISDEPYKKVTTVVVDSDGVSTTTIEIINTQGDVTERTVDTTTTDNLTYTLTEANTQYRLEGTWIEDGGSSSGVDALSAGTSGLITVTATE
ncbi:MAG: hypothetical protein EOL87_11550 [Spartobacteria bacterium]|nr:hypothetical protein [Spartobacteria bacterium]